MNLTKLKTTAVATAAALALATYGLGGPAVADPGTPAPPTPSALAQRGEGRPQPATLNPTWGLNPAPGQDCPTGSSRVASLASTTFDGGSAGSFTSGMTIATDATGTFARHVGTGQAVASILRSPALTPRPARVYVKFDVRGTFGDQDVVVGPGTNNGGTAWVVPSAAKTGAANDAWRTVHFDLTDGANETSLGLQFTADIGRDAASTTTVDIDNVEVYTCRPGPMGEPGDFNGDGLADAVFVMRDGNLLLSAGTLTQPRSLWLAGTGWQYMTWIGSTGDTDGDGYTDLMARNAAGDLLVYSGDGARGFIGSRKAGNGWQRMTSILPVGDVNGDGRQDLIARSGDGLMRLYSFRADGLLEGGTIVGDGWQYFSHIVAIRSSLSPAEPTRLYAIAANGDMKSYTVTSNGHMYGWGTKVGNGWSFPKVASVGDFDGDGRDDVLGVTATGTAYIYPTNGDGKWKPTLTLPETIWHAALLVG